MLNLANLLIEMSHPIYLLQIETNAQATGGGRQRGEAGENASNITTRLRTVRDVHARPSPAELERTLMSLFVLGLLL